MLFLSFFGLGDQTSLFKNRPKCSPTHFCQKQCIALAVEKSSPIMWATSELKTPVQSKQSYWANIRIIWSPCLSASLLERIFRGCAGATGKAQINRWEGRGELAAVAGAGSFVLNDFLS
jgi:hypothetical protein